MNYYKNNKIYFEFSVANFMDNRGPNACRNRYYKVHNRLDHGRWSEEEDKVRLPLSCSFLLLRMPHNGAQNDVAGLRRSRIRAEMFPYNIFVSILHGMFPLTSHVLAISIWAKFRKVLKKKAVHQSHEACGSHLLHSFSFFRSSLQRWPWKWKPVSISVCRSASPHFFDWTDWNLTGWWYSLGYIRLFLKHFVSRSRSRSHGHKCEIFES